MTDTTHVEHRIRGTFQHFQSTFHSRSKNRAKQCADTVRTLTIGPSTSPGSKKTHALSKSQIDKVKAELSNPKSAKKVIFQLQHMDPSTGASALPPIPSNKSTIASKRHGPVRAACLDKIEAYADKYHLARWDLSNPAGIFAESVVTAAVDGITSSLDDLHVVELIGNDFGFGQSASTSKGILAGAIPTAETVMTGIKLFTPQLMSLGYIVGKPIVPDHKGIYPPLDRMSVLTYWWGFELVLPDPTLVYLKEAESVSNTAIKFLTAIAAYNNGIREILPVAKYISQFLEFEFETIDKQNRGSGVVCAATWILPIAIVPRSWDFDPPPATLRPSLPSVEPEPPQVPPGPSQSPPPYEANGSATGNASRLSVRASTPASHRSHRPPSAVSTGRLSISTGSARPPSLSSMRTASHRRSGGYRRPEILGLSVCV